MDRRQFLKSTGLPSPPQALGAAPWRAPRRRPAPIKIGLLAPLTGVVASGGKEMVEGVQFYLDQVGNQIARPQGRTR